MKQICNYFMKGLLLCALVFGFWFMADAGVNADEVGIPKNFTPGTIEMVPFTKGENSNPYINITNNSDKPIKVTFEHNIEQTDHNYKLSIYVGNHECVSRQNPVAKDANVLYLYPYQRIEKACEVIFSSSASSSTSVTFYIKAAYLSKEVKKKEQAIGLNKNTAVEIPLSGMQNSLYEGGIRMPFLIKYPKKIKAGQVNNESVLCAVDLYPSLCAIAGIETEKGYQGDGQNYDKVLLGKSKAKRKTDLMWDFGRNQFFKKPGNVNDRSPHLAIRSGNWKLLINSDGSDAQLYDIEKDKFEKNDVAQSHPQVVAKLSKKVCKWFAENKDKGKE